MATEDLESLHETLSWLSRPGFPEDMAEAEADDASGTIVSNDNLRDRPGAQARVTRRGCVERK
jgi:antitoxin YefM